MTFEEKVKRVNVLKTLKDENSAKMATLKEEATNIDSELETLLKELLEEMKSQDMVEIEVEDLVASKFAKNEFSYGDEKALLNYLLEKNMQQYVTTKTTQSINKTSLKKDLKVNQDLKESLKDFVGDRLTEYVVVTTKENHQKMLEHIEANSK